MRSDWGCAAPRCATSCWPHRRWGFSDDAAGPGGSLINRAGQRHSRHTFQTGGVCRGNSRSTRATRPRAAPGEELHPVPDSSACILRRSRSGTVHSAPGGAEGRRFHSPRPKLRLAQGECHRQRFRGLHAPTALWPAHFFLGLSSSRSVDATAPADCALAAKTSAMASLNSRP